jgi:CubicO group peptidase (beta-lactamase class C family)
LSKGEAQATLAIRNDAKRVSSMQRLVLLLALLTVGSCPALARDATSFARLERGLLIERPGGKGPERMDLKAAMKALKVPSLSVALIDGGRIAFAHAWGEATPQTLYQAGSLSKIVAAVTALKLADLGGLDLDRSVNDEQSLWRAPENELTAGHPVTLRNLLSMTGGVNVPGYIGYEPGAPLPTLPQILNGEPPANSPAVEVVARPDSEYAYSGGGYEIVQALVESRVRKPFAQAASDFVFRTVDMNDSSFAQPPNEAMKARLAQGHDSDGKAFPGGWRVMAELAAGGLWSTPSDMARLVIEIDRAAHGERSLMLGTRTAGEMLVKQNHGPYGLGLRIAGSGEVFAIEKRGQDPGYQSYLLMFPQTGQGIVAMTNSDNGTTLISALIRRAAEAYGWPAVGELGD